MRDTIIRLLFILLLATGVSPALANDDGIFVGIFAAQAENRFSGNESPTWGVRFESFEESVSTYAFEISVPITDALSGDIVLFPKGTEDRIVNTTFEPAQPPPAIPPILDSQVSTQGALLSMSYHFRPLDGLVVYARAGALHSKSEHRAVLSTLVPPESQRFSESDTNVWVGIGSRYRIYDRFTLAADIGQAGDFQAIRFGVGWTF